MPAYILNTSFHMDETIKNDFIAWIKETYIPSALQSGVFGRPLLTKIMTVVEPGTVSFALHLVCGDLDKANNWHDNEGARMREMLSRRFGQRVVFFSTYMEEIE